MEEQQKTKLIYGIIALVVLVLIAVAIFGKKKFKTSEEERMWRAGEEQKVASLIRAGDFDACDKVSYKAADGIAYKTVCANNIALQKAVAELKYDWCAKLDDKLFSITDCKRQVMFQKLEKENTLSVCEGAPSRELKNQCTAGYWTKNAVEKNDGNLCTNIEETQASASCKDSVSIAALIKDPKNMTCDNFSAGLKNDCEQFKEAKKDPTKNFLACRTILYPQLQFACEQ